jgi:two-component system, chemotaxis family, protein-glutamate methylesterase/glutaminase
MSEQPLPLVVIGASMGGVQALQNLLVQLPKDFAAPLFVVQHIFPGTLSTLPAILGRAGSLPVLHAQNGEEYQPGHVYIAPPDLHLTIMDHVTLLTRGPKENRTRPAIDPLFRSAATAASSRAIGVILTGLLDDGTAGLAAIRRAGGIGVVQDPKDAAYPDMPGNAIAHARPEHVLPLSRMGKLLVRLVQEAGSRPLGPAPEGILLEVSMAGKKRPDLWDPEEWKKISLSCPECGGPMNENTTDSIRRFRCDVGHAFSAKSLLAELDTTVENSLWAAVRILEERSRMLDNLAADQQRLGQQLNVKSSRDKASESRHNAKVLRELLMK